MSALGRTCVSIRLCKNIKNIVENGLLGSSYCMKPSQRSFHVFTCPQTLKNPLGRGNVCSQLSIVSSFHTTSSNLANNKDFYKILGVSKNATQKEIKKAYYQLAKKFHPDTNKGDKNASKKFAEVAEAYDVLGDDSKRQQYDILGTTGYQANQQGQSQWRTQGFAGHMDPEDLFRKIFEEFSGGGGGSGSGFEDFREFAPLEVYMDLTFSEAAKGANKTLNIDLMDTCPSCKGKGNEPGTKITKCGHCGGTGTEQVVTGPFVMRSTCRRCKGTGKLITFPCVKCKGRGQVKQHKAITVPVPAGIEDKQTIRMQVGTREIFVTFRVAGSSLFRRQGPDVHSDVEISIAQAALGGTIRVPGVHNETELVIPPGTSSHERFEFPGQGIKKVNSYGFGAHYVHVKIKLPKMVTLRQKEALLEFTEEDNDFDGTVQGYHPTENKVETKTTSKIDKENEKSEKKSDHSEKQSDGFLSKLKKSIFG
uniref:DnaJ homolog subfamily A member 3, mitochondrial n=1 Tax=Phallusia mammillata TaxID=59560 RepID=A0A6F9DAJ8_9ASCI|nr:dnaJ homolog subfamily A member 3, mitochondrial [Phallusia mammillata]